MKHVRFAVLAALAVATPVSGAERSFTVTGFDRIRVDGPFRVTVTSGRGPSARASGDVRALDQVSMQVEGRTLVIRRNRSAWGGYPGEEAGPVTVAVTTPGLVAAWLNGAGSLDVDDMHGRQVDLAVEGSGKIALAHVDADQLGLAISGSGGVTIAGKAAMARTVLRGSADVAGGELVVQDAEVVTEGSGEVVLEARRSAKVTATGTGNVVITGDPACLVRSLGSGVVTCGRGR